MAKLLLGLFLVALFVGLPEDAGAADAQSIPECSASIGLDPHSTSGDAKRSTSANSASDLISPIPDLKRGHNENLFCDVQGFAIAAGDNGELRRIYAPDGTPDHQFSPPTEGYEAEYAHFIRPVIDNTMRRVAADAATKIQAYRNDPSATGRDNMTDQDVLNNMFWDANEDPYAPGIVHLLIYAHGGMVSHQDAVYSAESLAPFMMRDGFIPIFLIWNSDFAKSYLDRLCCVRRGASDFYPETKAYFAPTRLISDFGSSVMSAPENIGSEMTRFLQTNIRDFDLYNLDPDEVNLDCLFFDPKSQNPGSLDIANCKRHVIFPTFDAPDDVLSGHEQGKAVVAVYSRRLNGSEDNAFGAVDVRYLVLTPVWLTATAILPSSGAKAWDNMQRRTRLAFDAEWDAKRDHEGEGCFFTPTEEAPTEFPSRHRGTQSGAPVSTGAATEDVKPIDPLKVRTDEPLLCPSGGFTRFFNVFQSRFLPGDLAEESSVERMWVMNPLYKEGDPIHGQKQLWVAVSIEFYGHSMGAIVGDELISRYPQLPWSKIVYMAAADTIRDFKTRTARVIVAQHCTDGASKACTDARPYLHFYNLSLHPLNESREKEVWGVVPQGSLLEWVDELFNGPKTLDDRTLGKWKNFEETLPTWDRLVLEKSTAKVFPRQTDLVHGDGPEVDYFNKLCDPTPAAGENEPVVICYPLKHGDFNHYTFWRPTYYDGGYPADD